MHSPFQFDFWVIIQNIFLQIRKVFWQRWYLLYLKSKRQFNLVGRTAWIFDLKTAELMFVNSLTNFEILKLLSEFLFCLKKVIVWQSWLPGPKSLFPALVSPQTFSILWQILDVAEGRLLCLSSWLSLLKSGKSVACRLSKLLFWCLFCLKLSLARLAIFGDICGAGPKPK